MKLKHLIILIATLMVSFFVIPDLGAKADSTSSAIDWASVSKTKLTYNTYSELDSYYAAIVTNDSGINLYMDTGIGSHRIWGDYLTLSVNNKTYGVSMAVSGTQVTFTNVSNQHTIGTGSLTTSGTKQILIGIINWSDVGGAVPGGQVTLTPSSIGNQTIIGNILPDLPATSTGANSGTPETTDDTTPIKVPDTATTSSSESSSTSSKESSSESSDVSSNDSSSDTGTNANSESTATGNNQSGDLGITIDGDFNDWNDKDKHAMTTNGDNNNIKYASLLTDDQNIYFYLLMSPKLSGGYTNFQPSGYNLTVGGKLFYLSFNNNSTVNLNLGQKQAVAMNLYGADGSNLNLSNHAYVALQSIQQEMGDGTKVDGSGYVLECAIPISDLHGVSETSGQTISLSNSNLWTGSIKASGGNTGAIILVGIGFIIAVGSVWKFYSVRKKRG